MRNYFGLRQCCTGAAVCAAALLVVGAVGSLRGGTSPARAVSKTPWKVEVDLTAYPDPSKDKAVFKFSPGAHDDECSDGGFSQAPDTNDLCVSEGETISWLVKTSTGHAQVVIALHGQFLDDGSAAHKPIQRIDTVEGKWTDNFSVTQGTSSIYGYDYCIAAYDATAQPPHFYVVDPKMIVGGSRLNTEKLINQIEIRLTRLRGQKRVEADSKAESDVNQLLKIIKDLKDQLHLK
jgi:hypothetical protein